MLYEGAGIKVILKARNIYKSYRHLANTLDVLKGIDISLEDGEAVSIVGPSGAGKTTLLHILGGLDNPDEGEVFIDGENIYSMREADRAAVRNRKIGFVFQFYHLLDEFTALENVLLPAVIKSNKDGIGELREKGLALLARVGLKDRAGHKPQELSGGEQQRVAIARALVNEPRIILCDEPTGNLDSKSGEEIMSLLFELNKRNKQALIIVTHEQEIARLSHRTVHMKDGRLVTPEAL